MIKEGKLGFLLESRNKQIGVPQLQRYTDTL